MADFSELVLLIPCAYCAAQPGERCVTRVRVTRAMPRATAIRHYGPSGTSSYPHAARTRPVWAILQAGRFEGATEVVERLERAAGVGGA